MRAQHGHRCRLWASATVSRRRTVAIEFGTCRSGRIGSAARSVTFGKARRFEAPGATSGATGAGGEKSRPLGDQKAISRDAQRGVMVEAAPAAAPAVPEPDFLLEILGLPLEAPAQLSQVDQIGEAGLLGQGRQPVLRRLRLALGPLDQQPFLLTRRAQPGVCVRRAHIAHSFQKQRYILQRSYCISIPGMSENRRESLPSSFILIFA